MKRLSIILCGWGLVCACAVGQQDYWRDVYLRGAASDAGVVVTNTVDTADGQLVSVTNVPTVTVNDGVRLSVTNRPDVRLVNVGGNALGVDTDTRTLQTIDYAHHEIHSGSHYYINGHMTLGENVTNHVLLITPDSTKWAHFVWAINSSGITETWLDEGAVGGMTGGAAVTPINNNRNSTKTSTMVLTSGVSIATSYTTRVDNAKWGALGFKTTIGGGSGRDDEIILKRGTKYLRTFISGTADNIIQFKASWYEHSDKE